MLSRSSRVQNNFLPSQSLSSTFDASFYALQEVDEFLGRKANAFESDVSFFSDGFAGLTHHGFPCDCLRHCGGMANFSELLDYIRLKVDTGADLTLLLLDLKVGVLLSTKFHYLMVKWTIIE